MAVISKYRYPVSAKSLLVVRPRGDVESLAALCAFLFSARRVNENKKLH